jgi:hypothetical protein
MSPDNIIYLWQDFASISGLGDTVKYQTFVQKGRWQGKHTFSQYDRESIGQIAMNIIYAHTDGISSHIMEAKIPQRFAYPVRFDEGIYHIEIDGTVIVYYPNNDFALIPRKPEGIGGKILPFTSSVLEDILLRAKKYRDRVDEFLGMVNTHSAVSQIR